MAIQPGYNSSRVDLASVKEDYVGTTPGSPRMRLRRFSSFAPRTGGLYTDPGEIRRDRTSPDQVLYGKESGVSLGYDMIPFIHEEPIGIDLRSLLYGPWNVLPERVKDGVVSTLTSVTATTNVVTVTNEVTTFQVGHLVRFSGFANAVNNGVKRCTTASATVPVFSAGAFVTETAPVGARMKVVGFAGVSGDITATATGLAATTLVFTNMGLRPGDWIKIGGEASGTRFATAQLNCVARVVTVAASALTLDNLPSDWTTDAGSSKTIWVFMGDTCANGQTQTGQTFQRRVLGNTDEDYAGVDGWTDLYIGQSVSDGSITGEMNRPLQVSLNFDGLGSTVTLASNADSSPDAASTQSAAPVFLPRVHVRHFIDPQLGNLGGAYFSTATLLRSFRINVNNNVTRQEAANSAFPAAIIPGRLTVTGEVQTYFAAYGTVAGSDRSLNNTTGSIGLFVCNRVSVASSTSAGQSPGLFISIPRVKFTSPTIANISGPSQDLMNTYQFVASVDESIAAQLEPGLGANPVGRMISVTNFEYVEI